MEFSVPSASIHEPSLAYSAHEYSVPGRSINSNFMTQEFYNAPSLNSFWDPAWGPMNPSEYPPRVPKGYELNGNDDAVSEWSGNAIDDKFRNMSSNIPRRKSKRRRYTWRSAFKRRYRSRSYTRKRFLPRKRKIRTRFARKVKPRTGLKKRFYRKRKSAAVVYIR